MIPLVAWPLTVVLLLVGWARSYQHCDLVCLTSGGTEWALFSVPGELVFRYRTDALGRDGMSFATEPKRDWNPEARTFLGVDGLSGIAYRERGTPGTPFRWPTVERVVLAPFWLVVPCAVLLCVVAGP
jgi:hypothetical protein